MNPTQEEIAQANEEVRESAATIRSAHRNYDAWTVENFSRLSDVEVAYVRRTVALYNVADPTPLLPRSFTERYGDAAYAVFMTTIHREADRRNIEDSLASDILSSTYGITAGLESDAIVALNVVEPTTLDVPRGNGTTVPVSATPPEIQNYAMANRFMVSNNPNVTIPREAADAVIAANPILTTNAGSRVNPSVGYASEYSLQAAYDSGYASGAGLSSNIGNLRVGFDPAQASQAMPGIVTSIFTPTTEDDFFVASDGRRVPIDVRTAWTAGNIQQQMDRGMVAANDDDLYGVDVVRASLAVGGSARGGRQ